MNKITVFAIAIVCIAMGACQPVDKQREYYPFQSEKDGKWGLISPVGYVVVPCVIDNQPTVAVDGFYGVRNDSTNLWELYTATRKPRRIGGEYLCISPFSDDVAIVTEPGCAPSIIDSRGETLLTLDTIGGKKVAYVRAFNRGVAVFGTFDGCCGAINTAGEVVIEPVYYGVGIAGDNVIIALDNKNKGKRHPEYNVFDIAGNDLGVIRTAGKNITSVMTTTDDDALIATIGTGDATLSGIIDHHGEWILQPREGVSSISEYRNGMFIYSDGEREGVMRTNGTVVLQPQYQELHFASANVLIDIEGRGGKKTECLMDLSGRQVGTDTYRLIYKLTDYRYLALRKAHTFTIINDKGCEVIGRNLLIYECLAPAYDEFILNDKRD